MNWRPAPPFDPTDPDSGRGRDGGRSSGSGPPGKPSAPWSNPGRHGRRPGRARTRWIAVAVVGVLVLAAAVVGVDRFTSGRSVLARIGAALPTLGGPESPAPQGIAATAPLIGGSVRPSPAPSGGLAALPSHTGAKVKLAVFTGTSPSEVADFGRWLGRKPDYAVDFSSRDTWREIYDPSYMIDAWRGSGYRMVFTVGLLPNDQPATIKAGAKGAYDKYYRQLARNLVAGGQSDAILRLGWEFNLASSLWSTPDTKAFIAYWRHIVTAMRSVPGQHLKFDWNVNVGNTKYDGTKYYPGAGYVDYIGVDIYDVSWSLESYPYSTNCWAQCRLARQQLVWDRLLNGDSGLLYWSNFAQSKGKPMSIPEWGLWSRPDGHGGADNPYFITQMYQFIDDPANNVAYQGYFDTDSTDGQHSLTTLSSAGKTFRRLFK